MTESVVVPLPPPLELELELELLELELLELELLELELLLLLVGTSTTTEPGDALSLPPPQAVSSTAAQVDMQIWDNLFNFIETVSDL